MTGLFTRFMVTGTRDRDSPLLVQTGLFVAASTVALTLSFLGLVALLTGGTSGIEGRLPFYVLALAIAFVGSVVAFEGELSTGRDVLEATAASAVATFTFVFLAGEGVTFAVTFPDRVVSSQLLFYLLSAALIGTGVAYWGRNHWVDGADGRGGSSGL